MVAWWINVLGGMPTGLPKVTPQELSRLPGQNPKLCPEDVALGLLPPSPPHLLQRPAWVTPHCLCSGPLSPLGCTGACGFFFFLNLSSSFISQGSVLAPRLCPVVGVLWGRRGRGREEKISTLFIVQQLENCCHLFCLSFS